MGPAASAASNSGSMVEASGYKFAEKDMKPGKIKVRKQTKAKQKKAEGELLSGYCSFEWREVYIEPKC